MELPDGGFKFPLLTEPAADKPPNLDDQHHNVLEANNPHPPTEEGGGYTEAEIQEQLSNDLDELFPELFGPERDADPPPEDAIATRKVSRIPIPVLRCSTMCLFR